jgi:CBS domain containing-hemolysin-like protein
MTMQPLLVAGVLVAFAGLSFFFALAETALFTLSRWQLRQLCEAAPAAGQRVRRLREHADDLLATIVLGNTFANAGLVALGLWLVFRHAWPFWPVLGAVLLLVLVTGEVIPKTLAVRAPEFWAPRVAPAVAAWRRVVGPLCRLAQRGNERLLRRFVPRGAQSRTATTSEEYRELLDLAHEQGQLQASEREIILQILALDHRAAKDVMRPRAEVVALPDDLSLEEMIAAARRYRHRRLPLYDGSLDTIVGVLNTRRLLLDPTGDLAEAVEFPSFVPESMNLLTLLRSLQRQKRGLAIVLDEFGSTVGVVTIEDILGFAMGPVRSAGDTAGLVMKPLPEGGWLVSGAVRLDDFRRVYPQLGEVPEVDTMAGLVLAQTGVVPAVGVSVSVAGLRLTVTRASERRILELRVTPERGKAREAA